MENFHGAWETPYSAKDVFTKKITADKWMDELVAGYEYVLIYNCDDQFIQEFKII
ncbi:MAG: hypothetical protein JXA79_04405 [Deltaproteobacteria bacterium]|nr:hypothetical protein [Deltaproteobacteria bacterium]